MDTDTVLNRAELTELAALVRQEASRRHLGRQQPLWDLADKLTRADRVPATVAPHFRLTYGEPDCGHARELADLRDRVIGMNVLATSMIRQYLHLVDLLAIRLDEKERDELLAQVQSELERATAVIFQNLPAGAFPTPPGSIGVWAVEDPVDFDKPRRLFLDRVLADKAAGGDSRLIEPQIVWAVTPPRQVKVVTYSLFADRQGRRSNPTMYVYHEADPYEYPMALVRPHVQVDEQFDSGGVSRGWCIIAYGTRAEEIEQAVEQELARLLGPGNRAVDPDCVRPAEQDPPLV